MIRKYIYFLLFILIYSLLQSSEELTIDQILSAMDTNLYSDSQIMTTKMIVHGRRHSRTIVSKSWVQGNNRAYTEYLSPARDAGTKMLKKDDKLWTYSPQTDRMRQIAGHMLRQSLMGSDMSYNDMLEDQALKELYSGKIEKIEMTVK